MMLRGEGAANPLKRGYNICRIYQKAKIIKNWSEPALHKCNKCFLSQKITKFSDFIVESGGCMSLFLYMRLLPAVDVAASDLRCVGVQN